MTEQKKADNQAQLMLSVIVPVYNVQEYLLECMESIDAAIKNIAAEVLLIDDGSTDSSSEIAKAFLEEHHKFRYFHKENGGLAETRNFGISKASGKYLSFIDSDDLITEDMYEKMIASAEMHDADFTIINVARFNKKRIYDATLYVRMFNDVDETVTHISECGRLIYDTIVCNKLVRRDFWTENGFEFPVGWRFEDMAVALAMHCKARRISIVKTVGYLWRVRDGETRSITQENTSAINLNHRLVRLNSMYDFIDSEMDGDSRLRKLLNWKILTLDLIIYINAMADMSKKGQKEYQTILLDYFNKHYTRDDLEPLTALLYQKYMDLFAGRFKELLPIRQYGRKGYITAPIVEHEGKLSLRLQSELFDQEYYDAVKEFRDLVPQNAIDDVRYDDGKMFIKMHSYFQRISTPPGTQKITARLQNIITGEEYELPVTPVDGAYLTDVYGMSFDEVTGEEYHYDYSGAACEIGIDPRMLNSIQGVYGSYVLIVHYTNPVKAGSFFLKAAETADAVRALADGASVSFGESRARLSFDALGALIVNVENCRDEKKDSQEKNSLRAVLTESKLTDNSIISMKILLGDKLEELSGGDVDLCYYDKIGGRTVTLASGTIDNTGDQRIVSLDIDLNRPEILSNTYDEKTQVMLRQGSDVSLPVYSSREMRVSETLGSLTISFLADNNGCLAMLALNQDSLTKNRINYNLKFLYPEYMKEPIDDKVILFEAYWGAQYSCNPRALYEYIDANHPEYKCVWSLVDEHIPVKGNAVRVRRGSEEYFRYLATAKYLVNNVNFESGYKKRPEQIEIQTMHGTPLKTVGLDVKEEFRTEEQRLKYVKKNRRWNYLIAQGKFTEENAERWYGFNKKILRTGYPRTDNLFNVTDEEISKLKEKLALPSDKKIILYAPTFRRPGNYEMPMDLDQMKDMLSDEYILLIRLHHFITDAYTVPVDGEFIFDAGKYDNITDLYKIADILVTDYSSVMFDFALTGKPMVFFAYDLNEYISQTRGVYFDITTEGPGPIVKTNDELIKALMDGGRGNEDRVRLFREKYLTYERANSSEIIFNEVFNNRDNDSKIDVRGRLIKTLKLILPKKVFKKIRERRIKRDIG